MIIKKAKLIIGLLSTVFIVSAVAAGYFYVTNLNNQITELSTTNERLYTETKTLSNTLDNQTKYVDDLIKDINILNKSKSQLESKQKKNEILIKNQKNTINKLNDNMLIKKRTLLESKINKGTKKVFTDIEGIFNE